MDFIYNSTFSNFLAILREKMVNILQGELGLKFNRTRFLYKNKYIPIDIVLFEDNKKLGFFDLHAYKIAINKRLIFHENITDLENILRHEIAHLITFLDNPTSKPHQSDFHETCKRYKWGRDVWEATTNINLSSESYNIQKNLDHIFPKLQKLLNLSSSSNVHESNLALLKANQLLLKFNIEESKFHELRQQVSQTHVRRILNGKKSNAKHMAICEILKTFFVYPIHSYGHEGFYIEIIGRKSNVDIAEYVAKFLDQELERMWTLHKKISNQNGPTAKNSFMKGVQKGYLQKINEVNKLLNSEEEKALITINNSLQEDLHKVYPSLSHRRIGNKLCSNSFNAGIDNGKNLSINPALKQSSKKTFLLN